MNQAAAATSTDTAPSGNSSLSSLGPGVFALGDVFSELNADAAASEAAEAEDGGTGGASEAPAGKADKGSKAEAKADGKAGKADAGKADGEPEEDFSDDKPWTPERVKAAAGKAKELHDKSVRMWSKTEARMGKLSEERREFQAEKETFKVNVASFRQDVLACRKGDAKARLEALGRLFGKDGREAFEELTLEIAQNGKTKEPSAEAKQLKAELDELKAKLQKDDEAKELARQEAFVEQRKQELRDLGGDGERFPLLAVHAADGVDVGEAIATVITTEFQRTKGRVRLSDEEAAQRLEDHLVAEAERSTRALSKRNGTGPGSTTPGSGSGSPRASESRTAPSSPQTRGRSLSPGLTGGPTLARQKTVEELEEDAADFIPAALIRMANPNAGI